MQRERKGKACTKNVKHLWGENWTWEKRAQGIRSVSEGNGAPFSVPTPHAPFPKMAFNLGCFSKDSFFLKEKKKKKDCCLCRVFTQW